MGGYRFRKYKNGASADEDTGDVDTLTIVETDARKVDAIKRGVARGQIMAQAANFTRDMANEPANSLPPSALADRARELAKDAGVNALPEGSAMSLGHFVDTREEVDHVLARAAEVGARVHGAAHDRPWPIYSGYFSDPDGHLWEVLCLRRSEDAG